jgi:hypothetical protein
MSRELSESPLLMNLVFPAALPPDVRKWLCPSVSGAFFFGAMPPSLRDQVESDLPGARLWFGFDDFLAKLSGHSPIKNSAASGRAQPLPHIGRQSREEQPLKQSREE